ncbi:MAG: hypothetical protein [Olavius algarvensis Gamma 1 endosymbiont]|nr:MAG: hypothetical protein [Olavius algarvensis Gamma 1 endosymbiont]
MRETSFPLLIAWSVIVVGTIRQAIRKTESIQDTPGSANVCSYPLHVNILVSEVRLSRPRARRDEEE